MHAVALFCLMLLASQADPVETKPAVQQAVEFDPSGPTVETWPKWRARFLALAHADGDDESDQFEETVRDFFGKLAGDSATLPPPWSDDPMAWVAVGQYQLQQPNVAERFAASIEAFRKAIALGDPEGCGSAGLARALMFQVMVSARGRALTASDEEKLREADESVAIAQAKAPAARLNLTLGMLARLRGQRAEALRFLKQSVKDFPRSEGAAVYYLDEVLEAPELQSQRSQISSPIAERFPKSAQVQARHVAALFSDGRYPEAHAAAEPLRDQIAPILGPEAIAAVDKNRGVTAEVLAGSKAIDQQRFDEAQTILRGALAKDPDNLEIAKLLVHSIVKQSYSTPGRPRTSKYVDAVKKLAERYPNVPDIDAGYAAVLFQAGRKWEAVQMLDQIEQQGHDPAKFIGVQGMRAIRKSAPMASFWGRVKSDSRGKFILVAIGAWIGWVAFMALAGVMLSRSVRPESFADRALDEQQAGRATWTHRFYLLLLVVGLLLFYVSIPFVALGLILMTLLLFVAILMLRVIHFGVLYRGFYATYGVLRGAVAGPYGDIFGIAVTAEEHPRLFGLLDEVAADVDTQPIDSVYLTPGTSIGVSHHGRGPFGMFGKQGRVLQIGISILPSISVDELRSIMAHEYAHFSHNDTWVGRFMFQVCQSLQHSLYVLSAAGGWLNYINPFYWAYWCYLRSYTLLSAGFLRSREYWADHTAARLYGKEVFASGLTKVSIDSALFDQTVVGEIRSLLADGKAHVNVYEAYRTYRDRPEVAEAGAQWLRECDQKCGRWYDTHPSIAQRLAAVSHLPDGPYELDPEPASSLLADIERVEENMTDLLTGYISMTVPELAAAK